MAFYIFDTATQSDVNSFTASDYLFFLTGSVADLGVVDTPGTSSSSVTTAETITLTENGKSLTFHAANLSAASLSNHVIFNNEIAIFGTSAADTALSLTAGSADHGAVAFGFAGADSIVGGAANDTIYGGAGDDTITGSSSTHVTASNGDVLYTESDYLNGGNGADLITGGDGNDHIYGNAQSSTAGAADGNDTISAGNGNDYVNGNLGADSIDGGAGNDKLYGGADNDTILGGEGHDYLQGNKGFDVLDGGNGNDTVHGGADGDSLVGGDGNDQLWGDAGNDTLDGGNGNDTIHGGLGYDSLTGSAGNDVFVFTTGEADIANLTSATTATGHGTVDVITDFTTGDHLSLGFTPTTIDIPTTTFATVDEAYSYAKGLLTGAGHGTEVVETTVGTSTYLFYDSTHTAGTIDSAIQLSNAHTLVAADFV